MVKRRFAACGFRIIRSLSSTLSCALRSRLELLFVPKKSITSSRVNITLTTLAYVVCMFSSFQMTFVDSRPAGTSTASSLMVDIFL
jgi:hypothetical protein